MLNSLVLKRNLCLGACGLHSVYISLNKSQVRLVYAERRQCAKTLELTKWIELEYRKAARERQKARPLPSAGLRPGDPSRAYFAHLDNISRHMTVQDMGRNQRYWPLWRKIEGLEEKRKEERDRLQIQ